MWEIALSIGIAGIMFFLAYISSIFSNSLLKLFFIFGSEIMVILGLNIAINLSQYVSEQVTHAVSIAYKVSIVIFITTAVYVIIYYIIQATNAVKIKNEQ